MGSVISKLFTDNYYRELFMHYYLTKTGPTPHFMNLIPGGYLRPADDAAVARHKFKKAIRKQRALKQALEQVSSATSDTRCLSPCLMTDFDLPRAPQSGTFRYKYHQEPNMTSGRSSRVPGGTRPTRGEGFGTLERLITLPSAQEFRMASSEEILSCDLVEREQDQNQRARKLSKERRARSRPERSDRLNPLSQRQAQSATSMRSDANLKVVGSNVVIERIEVGSAKKAKRFWPPRDHLAKVLKDPKSRPSTFFLARFRRNCSSEYVEVDYRYNKNTKDETFTCHGSLANLLPEDVRDQFLEDQNNNNASDKDIFFQNLVQIVNTMEGRIWWNGFIISVDDPSSQRMRLHSVEMNPPQLVFDMTGLYHISATRTFSKLSLFGTCNKGDVPNRCFSMRGKTEQETKQVVIRHEKDTYFVKLVLPLLQTPTPAFSTGFSRGGTPTATSRSASVDKLRTGTGTTPSKSKVNLVA